MWVSLSLNEDHEVQIPFHHDWCHLEVCWRLVVSSYCPEFASLADSIQCKSSAWTKVMATNVVLCNIGSCGFARYINILCKYKEYWILCIFVVSRSFISHSQAEKCEHPCSKGIWVSHQPIVSAQPIWNVSTTFSSVLIDFTWVLSLIFHLLFCLSCDMTPLVFTESGSLTLFLHSYSQ